MTFNLKGQSARYEWHMDKPVSAVAASEVIDARIREFGDWRGKMHAKVRDIIHDADPKSLEIGE